uniref:Uncharacterized protein n=1 Tax=viral metagenome TaxID=1070528 RepID=A0A6C0D2P9_9ZZZZ
MVKQTYESICTKNGGQLVSASKVKSVDGLQPISACVRKPATGYTLPSMVYSDVNSAVRSICTEKGSNGTCEGEGAIRYVKGLVPRDTKKGDSQFILFANENNDPISISSEGLECNKQLVSCSSKFPILNAPYNVCADKSGNKDPPYCPTNCKLGYSSSQYCIPK